MGSQSKKLDEIQSFISDYYDQSQKRGKMYGSISELESNWNLLDQIFFLLNDLQEKMHEYNFAAYLRQKGYGAKSAAMIINENQLDDPYKELNDLWSAYLSWRKPLIRKEAK